MIVGVSGRVIENQVGGNSRYVNELSKQAPRVGLDYRPVTPGQLKLGGRPGVAYALAENLWPLRVPKDIDLLHYPADTGPMTQGRIPLVTTIHGMASLHVANVRSARSEWLWRTRVGRAAHVSRHVITVSSNSASDLMRAFELSASKISVIPHGIDHQRFHADSTADKDALAGLNLPQNFCLYLGNLDPRKNIVRLIQAFDEAPLVGADAHLVIAGRPAWDAGPILDAIRTSSKVTYLGPVTEAQVAPLMRRASAFTFPSLYEGFGFPVLEAMACGTPVICSSRGSLAEVAGDNSVLVDPMSEAEIAAGIHRVLTDSKLASDLRRAGLSHASSFQWSRSAEGHRDCFQSVLAAA